MQCRHFRDRGNLGTFPDRHIYFAWGLQRLKDQEIAGNLLKRRQQ